MNKKEAKEFLLKALELSPRHEAAHLAFWLLMKADSPVEALDHLQKVVMQNINNTSAWRQIAVNFPRTWSFKFGTGRVKVKCNFETDNSVRLEYIQYMMFGGDVSGARALFEALVMNTNASLGDQRVHAHLAYWLICPEAGIEMTRLVTLYPEGEFVMPASDITTDLDDPKMAGSSIGRDGCLVRQFDLPNGPVSLCREKPYW
ncbi:MAG: hypothetical protein IPJ38_01730 [Dechloromonas sp.]|uniref:Tetratricopeptide repeat protein n=1 Tax=Candidatus Dechloromonas phosphorivorans TaxID=2899244 RepID=A0A935K023_9RHOO|nr:hypothetical protein [Candidatus Dechloromonas phosphorivorans]